MRSVGEGGTGVVLGGVSVLVEVLERLVISLDVGRAGLKRKLAHGKLMEG